MPQAQSAPATPGGSETIISDTEAKLNGIGKISKPKIIPQAQSTPARPTGSVTIISDTGTSDKTDKTLILDSNV